MDTKTDYKEFVAEISTRGIRNLLHFTRFENITAIVGEGKILPRNQLHNIAFEWRELATPNYDSRRDNPSYINTSITHPNVYLLNHSNSQRPGRFCIIGIEPRYIYEQNTKFSITNATYEPAINFGINDKFTTFQALFGAKVEGQFNRNTKQREKLTRSISLPEYYTTDPQAEVLIRCEITYNDFIFIACRNQFEYDVLASAFDVLELPTEKLCVQPTLFESRQ
ncbi:MAG: DarT ssDNA thymidine ADP-ribosyltransferase family protein [Caldilineaceae bacterium]